MPHRDPAAQDPNSPTRPSHAASTDALEERLRLAEARLEELTAQLAGESVGTPEVSRTQGRLERRLDGLAQRLHDLAQEQRRLRTDLSVMLDRVDSTTSEDPPVSGTIATSAPQASSRTKTSRAATPADPATLPRKVLALGRSLARRLRPGPPRHLVHLTHEVGVPARHLPTLGVVWPEPDPAGPPSLSEILGTQSQPPEAVLRPGDETYTLEAGDELPDLVLEVPSQGLESLADPEVGPVPTALCEMLRLLFASEDLDFAEVVFARELPPWVCRRRLPEPSATRGRDLGKVLLWNGSSTAAHHWLGDRLEIGRYRDLGTALPHPHRLHPLDGLTPAPSPDTKRPAILFRLPSLLAGNDRWVADLALAVESDRRLLVTLESPTSRLDAERRRTLERRFPHLVVAPLADVLAAHLVPSALVPLAHRHRVEAVVTSDDTALAPLPGPLQPLPQIDPPREPTTGLPWVSAAAVRFPGAPEVLRQRVRQRLGIPASATLVVQAGDLVTSQRPDSFVALARHLADDPLFYFLLVGRGPLAGTVDDLVRYGTLDRFLRRSDLPDDEVWAAADIACCLGDPSRAPQAVVSALAAGKPWVGPSQRLRPWRPSHLRDVELDSPERLASALRSLPEAIGGAVDARDGGGDPSADDISPATAFSATTFSAAATQDAWRRCLGLPTPV